MEKTLKKRITSSIIFQFAGLFIAGLISIIIVPIIVDNLGKESFGLFELILSLSFINFFLDFGLGNTLIKYTPYYREKGIKKLNEFISTFLTIKIILAIFGVIIVLIISHYFEFIFNSVPINQLHEVKISCIIFSVGVLLTNITGVWDNILKGFVRFDNSVLARIFSSILYLSLVYLIVKYFNFSLINLSVVLFIIVPFFKGIYLVYFLKKEERGIVLFPNILPSKEILKEIYRYLGGMSIISLVAQFYNRLPIIILGIITNPMSVAIFGAAGRIKNPLNQLVGMILRPLIPAGTEIELSGNKSFKTIILKMSQFESIIIIGLSTLLIIYMKYIINIWLGTEFNETTIVIQIWLIPLLLPRSGAMLMFYYSQGKTKANIKFQIINTVVGISLAILFTFYYGVVGLVSGIVISSIIVSIMMLFFFCKEFNFKVLIYIKDTYLFPFIGSIFTSIISILILKYYKPTTFLSLCIAVFFSGFVYMFILFIFNPKSAIKNNFNLFFNK